MRALRRLLPWLAALGALWVIRSTLGLFVVNLLLVYVMVSVGLNLLMGYTGQISAGHAGFLAVGAYTAALVAKHVPMVGMGGSLAAAAAVTSVVGLAIGLPVLRLAGFYIAMATLAFGVVISEAILQLKHWTGGADGMYVTAPSLFGLSMASDERKFWLVLAAAAFTVFTAWGLGRSKVGRAFLALKESPVAAEAMGIHTPFYKTLAFVVSAFYTGLAGGLFAYVVSYLSPDAFSLGMSIDFTAMVIVGGMGSLWGSILGAAFLTALNQYLASLQDARALIFGLTVIVSMIFMPSGLSSLFDTVAAKFRRANGPASAGPETESEEVVK
jgi:branched-chain amino acid transport system permease protein